MALTHAAAPGFGFRMPPRANFDIPDSLLAQVDFKWLMAGHGWHVDTARFDEDPAYASQMLEFALSSQSSVLRDSAAALMAQKDRATARGSGPD